MEINFFDDPNHKPQPKDQIKITGLVATPYPDRFRVYIEIKVTPFLERPNLLLVARAADGTVVGDLNIIATMHANMEFTMHIRNVDDPAGDYELLAELFYETRNPPQDQRTTTFTIPEASE